MDFCPKSLGDLSTHTALNVDDPKNINTSHWYILNANLEKNLLFPRIENLSKICKNCTNITIKALLKHWDKKSKKNRSLKKLNK
jgi:hypothetical protein